MNNLKKSFLVFSMALLVGIQGCSSLPPFKGCIDCTQFPLVYQGTIEEYTQGVYIETACLTIDLSKFRGFENFTVGDIVHIEYVVKQGEFCSDKDESIYRIYTVKNDKDFEIPSDIIGSGEGIQLK